MASSLKYTLHHYGEENELQRLGVWEVDIADKSKYWIIYIHGGAWRDPRIKHESFAPSIDAVLADDPDPNTHRSNSTINRTAAFASLDYRLSPHPDFPQDPATTPPAQYPGVRHPDHLDDVPAALAFLQRRYGFGVRYVLVGHSAGACMALQLLGTAPLPASSSDGLSDDDDNDDDGKPHLILPQAIVCFEGIYDFAGLNARFDGAYAGFMSGAFGNPEDWNAAAPVTLTGNYRDRWQGGGKDESGGGDGDGGGGNRVALLAWSPDDTLVDEPEVDAMARRLGADGVAGVVVMKDLEGDHDEIWEKGDGVARMMRVVFGKLV
ncbi:Uu.00g088520.m01.CDS01 [Anthostomella pinea]|uniref:Kynurenine formamidase n=1 Tax=Anthostomella pinea TaxID=933095 RepID=A0AAI8YJZ3_9PEZI|nr:Uu.00g088520.m01.CDS01 [Anthostomella pinea]